MGFYTDYAQKLVVKPVHAKVPQNDTGYLTPPELYTGYLPFHERIELIHATVGENTLPYFADKVDHNWNVVEQAGSVRDGRLVCAHQLLPKDAYTIYDMVPAGYGCGHCNPGVWRGINALNFNARGYELENLQNGDTGEQFVESQYIKLALTISYHTAVSKVRNLDICSHFDASMGAILEAAGQQNQSLTFQRATNAHTDPNHGPFDWGLFYGHLFAARQERSLFDLWQQAPWSGR